MKITKILSILALILILGVIITSGCTNNPINQTTSSHFENSFVNFELPAGVTAKDTSNDTSLDIILFKNGKSIGEIDDEITSKEAIDAIDGSNTTFAGKNAIESNDEFGSQLYIKIRNDTQGNTIGIRIALDPGYSQDYEVIKNSFIIKKTP